MVEPQRPSQRQVSARVLTPAGWLTGTFHLPAASAFLNFLNGTRDFFTLTSIRLPGQSSDLPFLALQRSAAVLVVPSEDAHIEPETGANESLQTHQVSCLLEGGVLMGKLRLPFSIRVSDHLMREHDFIVVRECTLALDEPQGVEALPIAIVNAARVVGVAEV